MLNLNAMFNVSSVTPDTSEDITVNNESLDADYLLNDLSSSINAISSQFSALMSSSNRISDMYSYIKLYGVDRACVQVYNRDGLLTDLSNGVVPAIEDFRESNVSKYTIACMEGLGEAITKAFKWCIEKLKAIGKWIADKVIGAFKWLMSKFSSNKKQIANGMKQSEKLALMANKIKGDESQITPEMKQKVAEVDEAYIRANKKMLDDIAFLDELVNTSSTIIEGRFNLIEDNIKRVASEISKINTGEDISTDIPVWDTALARAGGVANFSKGQEKETLKMLEKITEAYTVIYSGKTEATPEYGGILKHCIKSHMKFTKEVYTALVANESKIEKIIQESAGHADKLKKEVEQLHSDLAKALEKVDINSANRSHLYIRHCIAGISTDLQAIINQILDLGKHRLIFSVYPNMDTLWKILEHELQKYVE